MSSEGIESTKREQLYTPDYVGRRLGLTRSAVYSRINSGEIRATKFHHRPGCSEPCHCPLRIPSAWFESYLKRHVS